MVCLRPIASIFSVFFTTLVGLTWLSVGHADNTFLVRLYNEIANSRICGPVRPQAIEEIFKECNCDYEKSNPIGQYFTSSTEMYEWAIFQMAAEKQLAKNSCVNGAIDVLLSKGKHFDLWFSVLLKTWVASQKGKAVLYKCKSEVNFLRDSEITRRKLGLEPHHSDMVSARTNVLKKKSSRPAGRRFAELYTSPYEKIPPEWRELCSNEEKMSALEMAPVLLENSVPIIGSPDFFAILERHPNLFKNSKTGKSAVARDFLDFDLQQESFEKTYKRDPKVQGQVVKELTEALQQLKSERARVNKNITKGRDKKGQYDLDQETRDTIFTDDTIRTVLLETDQLPQGGPTDLGKNGAKCILNRYEPSFGGEMAELAVTSFMSGAGFYKLFKLKQLTHIAALKKAAGAGLTVGSVFSGLKVLVNKCSRDIKSKTASGERGERRYKQSESIDAMESSLGDISSTVGSSGNTVFSSEDDLPQVAACKDLRPDYLFNSFHEASCTKEAILQLLNSPIFLPAQFLLGD